MTLTLIFNEVSLSLFGKKMITAFCFWNGGVVKR